MKAFRRQSVVEGETNEPKEQVANNDVSPALAYKPTCPLDHSAAKAKVLVVKASQVSTNFRNSMSCFFVLLNSFFHLKKKLQMQMPILF